jgi:hypothetical protein
MTLDENRLFDFLSAGAQGMYCERHVHIAVAVLYGSRKVTFHTCLLTKAENSAYFLRQGSRVF